jgi:hypothetical protein
MAVRSLGALIADSELENVTCVIQTSFETLGSTYCTFMAVAQQLELHKPAEPGRGRPNLNPELGFSSVWIRRTWSTVCQTYCSDLLQ